MRKNIEEQLNIVSDNFLKLKGLSSEIEQIAKMWIETLSQGHKIIFCGNGGSAADSQHLAAELMGKYNLDRKPLAAMSLTTDTSALTAISNDYGYEQVFSRHLRGIGQKGDILVGISTSGNSQNIIEAFKVAKEMDIKTIAFTGDNGGKLLTYADILLSVPSNITNNIQEMHIAVGHVICGIVENYFYTKNII